MQDNFTEKAREAITKAQQYAVRLGHNYVGTEHILLGRRKRQRCRKGDRSAGRQ